MNDRSGTRLSVGTANPEEPDTDLATRVTHRTTVLIVEDEPHVRGLARRILAGQAYRVFEAIDGVDAIRVAAKQNEPIDLVITDVEMPNIGVRAMMRGLRRLDLMPKVLFMSGYSDPELLSRGFDKGHDPFLTKPFSGRDLVAAVRKAIRVPVASVSS